MPARVASASTPRSPRRLSAIHAGSERSGSRSGRRQRSCVLSWVWPPGRLTKTTSSRATARATSAPRSSSTKARARSIPAVTPADVATEPSRTKIRSGSTRTCGCAAASAAQSSQCVVAPGRRAARPARGRTRPCRRWPCGGPTRGGRAPPDHLVEVGAPGSAPGPAQTMIVSTPRTSPGSGPPGTSPRPLSVTTGSPRGATTSTSYAPGRRTAGGVQRVQRPARSSAVALRPNTTSRTRRGMARSSRRAGRLRKDRRRTVSATRPAAGRHPHRFVPEGCRSG
jgi:hypothetical protein